MNIISAKKDFRARMRARRQELVAAMPDHATHLADHASALAIAAGTIVGGYMALAGEADPSFLMKHLAAKGARLAVPRVTGRHEPLVFHTYESGTELKPGAFGIAEPDPSSPQLEPHILLVPLLAFDAKGHRLGYGGGYYDRTLAALRARHSITAIGVAYAGQEVEKLAHEDFDEPLDMVLTETGLRPLGTGA